MVPDPKSDLRLNWRLFASPPEGRLSASCCQRCGILPPQGRMMHELTIVSARGPRGAWYYHNWCESCVELLKMEEIL